MVNKKVYLHKKCVSFFVMLILLMGLLSNAKTWAASDVPITVNEKDIRIPSLSKEYKIVIVNDLHLICPDETTQEFMDLIIAENSPVCEVAAAHLHFGYDAPLTEKITEYIFPPAFEKNLGLITIHP